MMKNFLTRYVMPGTKWFLEFTTENEGSLHSLKEIIYTSQTGYQKIEILRLGSYGKALVLDGKIQSTEADEFIYHEVLVHPSLISFNSPQKVLIAGGGEGATIREVLRYPSIESVYMVDIDREVVEACTAHLPEWHRGCFDDRRVRVFYDDARRFIAGLDELFDVIILDLPEPMEEGTAVMLYTREFYREISEHLTPEGVMVTQATAVSVNNLRSFSIIHNTINEVFPEVRGYWASVPSFFVPWGFVFASKKKEPAALTVRDISERLGRLNSPLRYYNPEVHHGLFALPEYLKAALGNEKVINTDKEPLSFY